MEDARGKNYKQKAEDKYKEDSKERLSKIMKKKINTTMIGALSSIEDHFGSLWNNGQNMTDEQQALYDTYQVIRSEILDKGNNQSRNVDAELNQYEVNWTRYKTNIPIITQEELKTSKFGQRPLKDKPHWEDLDFKQKHVDR